MLLDIAEFTVSGFIRHRRIEGVGVAQKLSHVSHETLDRGLGIVKTVLFNQIGIRQILVCLQITEELQITHGQTVGLILDHVVDVLHLTNGRILTVAVSIENELRDVGMQESIEFSLLYSHIEGDTQLLLHHALGGCKLNSDLVDDALGNTIGRVDQKLTFLGINQQLAEVFICILGHGNDTGNVTDVSKQLSSCLLTRGLGGLQLSFQFSLLFLGSTLVASRDILQNGISLNEGCIAALEASFTGNVQVSGTAHTRVVVKAELDEGLSLLLGAGDLVAGIGNGFVSELLFILGLVVLVVQNGIVVVHDILIELINVRYAHTGQELMANDQLILQILGNGVEVVIDLDNVVEPDIITNGVILAGQEVFLQNLRVLIGQGEVNGSTVFDCLQLCVVKVTLHVQRRTCKVGIAVQNNAQERNAVACADVTAGIQGSAQNVIDELPGVSVTAVDHDFKVRTLFGGEVLESLLYEALGVLTVVRFVLIKVGVQGITEGCNRDTGYVVILEVVTHELLIEVAEVCGGDRQLEVARVSLAGSQIETLTGITVVDGSDCVLTEIQTVEEAVGKAVNVREIEVRVNAEVCILAHLVDLLFELGVLFVGFEDLILLCIILQNVIVAVVDGVCEVNQLLELGFLADGLFPLQLVGHIGEETTVGVTCQLEVDVVDALSRELSIHGLNVLEGCQRLHDLHRDGHDLFYSLNGTECLDVQGNITGGLLLGEGSQNALVHEVVTVSHCHTQPSSIIPRIRRQLLLLGNAGVGQHDVMNLVVTNVLTGRNNGPVSSGTNRDCVCHVVSILRSGIEAHLDRVIRMLYTLVLGCDLGHCVAFFDDSDITAIDDVLFCIDQACDQLIILGQRSGQRGELAVLVLLQDVIDHTVDGRGFGFTRRLIEFVEVIVSGLFDDTEDRITNGLLVSTGDLVVRVVGTVDLAGNRVAGYVHEVLKGEQRARAIGEEGVTVVSNVTCAHVRQDANAFELELRLVETDTVCRETDREAVLTEGILQSQLKERRVLVFTLILGHLVVNVHFLVGVVRTSCLDVLLALLKLDGGSRGVKDVDVHLGNHGVNRQKVILQTVRGAELQTLELVVGHELLEVEVLFIIIIVLKQRGADERLETGLLDHTGNEASCFLTTDGVFHTDTVLDVLDLDLVTSSSVFVAEILLRTAVFGIADDDLRHQLHLNAFHSGGSANVIGVGEQDLAGSQILYGYLTGVLIRIELVIALGGHQLHGSQLLFGSGENLIEVIGLHLVNTRAGFGRALRLSRRNREEGEASQRAAQHENS